MQTKLKIQNKVNITIFILFVLFLMLKIFVNIFNLNLYDFLIISIAVALGLSLIFKGVIFKSEHPLWFGMVIILYSIMLIISTDKTQIEPWIYFMVLVLVSLFVGLIHNEEIQYKLATLSLFLTVAVYFYNKVSVICFILIVLMSLVLGFLVQKFIPVRKGR